MKLAALSVVAAMFAMTASTFAQANHAVCAAKQHDCGKVATISACCCGDQDAGRSDSTPVQDRVDLRAEAATPVNLPAATQVLPALAIVLPVQTSPPRLCLLDLPTLFATFLM
jgi:hypothetical protein